MINEINAVELHFIKDIIKKFCYGGVSGHLQN